METPEAANPKHVLLTVSVTFRGEGQDPLVATSTVVDGQEVTIPLAVLLGQGPSPLFVAANLSDPATSLEYAKAFSQVAADTTQKLLDLAGQALNQASSIAKEAMRKTQRGRKKDRQPPSV
jgi:hypothetical protein